MTSYLLDTNILLWLATDRSRIRAKALTELFEASLYASVISPVEIAIKMALGRLPLPQPFQTDFGGAVRSLLERTAVELLPLDLPVVEHLRHLPLHHRDPFDRIIIAQAFALGLTVATSDRAFAAYDGLDVLEV